jgi:glycosyltransferase involved in cell wall biosynthesis
MEGNAVRDARVRSSDTACPRVLRVITRLNIGGPARQAVFLTDDLRRRGFETRLVWGASGPGEGTVEPAACVPTTYLPWLARDLRPMDDVRAAMALSGIMRRWHPDVVHTHLAKAGTLGRSAALRSHVPVIVHTFHGHVLQEYFSRLKNAAFARVERSLAARTDALVAVAPWVRDELLAMGIGDERRWHVVPVGVDLDAITASRLDRTQARRRLDLPPDGPVVTIVGRLVSIKDHATFIRAAGKVLAEHPGATFVVAGDGPMREDVELDARLTLGDAVRFTGWVDDLPALYRASDIVVLTSRSEGTPVALIEAAAAGTPVVATDVGGVREVVLNGVTGDLVPPGDHRAVAAALDAMLRAPARAAAYGAAGPGHVLSRFSQARLATDLTELYGELLARKAAASAGAGIRSRVTSRQSQTAMTAAPTPSTTA